MIDSVEAHVLRRGDFVLEDRGDAVVVSFPDPGGVLHLWLTKGETFVKLADKLRIIAEDYLRAAEERKIKDPNVDYLQPVRCIACKGMTSLQAHKREPMLDLCKRHGWDYRGWDKGIALVLCPACKEKEGEQG